MRKRISLIIILSLLLGIVPAFAETESVEVDVNLASGDITINGTEIDNSKEAFPFVSYKDITYFPMTWDFAKSMGLSTEWTPETGLIINKSGYGEAVELTPTADNDLTKSYKAIVSSSKIEVEGKSLNNSTEEFPILTFRDITYFPMTWRFMVEEFGTEYSWNAETGLNITSSLEVNPSVNFEGDYVELYSKFDTFKGFEAGYNYYPLSFNEVTSFDYFLLLDADDSMVYNLESEAKGIRFYATMDKSIDGMSYEFGNIVKLVDEEFIDVKDFKLLTSKDYKEESGFADAAVTGSTKVKFLYDANGGSRLLRVELGDLTTDTLFIAVESGDTQYVSLPHISTSKLVDLTHSTGSDSTLGSINFSGLSGNNILAYSHTGHMKSQIYSSGNMKSLGEATEFIKFTVDKDGVGHLGMRAKLNGMRITVSLEKDLFDFAKEVPKTEYIVSALPSVVTEVSVSIYIDGNGTTIPHEVVSEK